MTAFDPMVAHFDQVPTSWSLEVTAPDGQELVLEPQISDSKLMWLPDDHWSEGTYRLTSIAGFAGTREFEVVPYGVSETFAGLQPGVAYRIPIENLRLHEPVGLDPFIAGVLPDFDAIFEVLEVGEGELDYRVVLERADGSVCSAHTATASIDSRGLIEEVQPTLEVPMLDTLADLHDMSLRLGVLGDEIGAIRVRATLDTTALADLFEPPDPEGTCDWLWAISAACTPCPESFRERCVAIEMGGAVGLIDPDWDVGVAMPSCSVPLPDEPVGGVPRSEGSCGCATHGAPSAWLLGLLFFYRANRVHRPGSSIVPSASRSDPAAR